jgi:hypothetical protein
MQTQTLKIDSKIEIGTATGMLRVNGEELACLVSDRFLSARLIDGRFVLSGGQHGEHSLDAHELITSEKRLLAHWRGYVENNS